MKRSQCRNWLRLLHYPTTKERQVKRTVTLAAALSMLMSYPAQAGLISAYQRYEGYKHSKNKSQHTALEIERHFLNRHSTYRKLKHDYYLLTPERHERPHLLNKLKDNECKRLHFEYMFRHPPGTKPESSKGSHGCHLWKEDAHWHDAHPNTVTILGVTASLGF